MKVWEIIPQWTQRRMGFGKNLSALIQAFLCVLCGERF
jgi:hypothetical protein